jgi:thiazole synthase
MRALRDRLSDVPLIVDAGLGLLSHACQVMELGFDGVLVNTAVSRPIDPVRMATAFASAPQAGRSGDLGGPMPTQDPAVASTPEIGKPFSNEASRLVSKETA